MSNVIKAYTVRYEDEMVKTIDSHTRINKELENKRIIAALNTQKISQDGFVEGLKAVMVETLPSPEEVQEQTSKITEDAMNEAKKILDQAKNEAEKLKNDVLVVAQKKGYDDGMAEAKKEITKSKAEYDEKARLLQEEYDAMVKSLEPQMVQIIAALVEKITGIVVEDKQEVILYLIEKAMKNVDKSDEYTIRVSREDYEYVTMSKNLLLSAIGREVALYVIEDPTLKKNQCLIETELKVINCSLDVQLNNLITDLKLLGGV